MQNLNTLDDLHTDEVQKTVKDFFSYGENRAANMVKPSTRAYFIGNGKAANLEPKFPKLGVTDFDIVPVQALVADPINPNMAMPVPDQPGVPSLYLTNASSKGLIGKPVGKQYHIYSNKFCYLLAQLSLKKSLPCNFLQNITVEEDFDRDGAFSAIHIDVEDWKMAVETGNYKTVLHFGVTIKHNVNEAILYSIYARDVETDNRMNLGTVATSSFYHAENSNPDKIKRHTDFWVTKGFPHRIEQLRKALRTAVTDQDIKLVLSTGRLLTTNQQEEIFQQIVKIEAQDMGKTSYAVMSGLATWASDAEAFPVSSDNVGEAMAKRQGIVARIMMCKAMLGRELEINA